MNVVIDASELGTWEFNLKTNALKYSGRYLEIFGYDKDSHPDHAEMLNHLHPDDMHIRMEAFKEAYLTGIIHYQARIIWNDKSIHWMEVRGKVIFDSNKQPEKMIGTIRDITEERQYQQRLQEREEKFRLLADSMPQHVWTADPIGNLNYFNESVYNYSGLTPSELNELGWLHIVHPEEKEENVKKWLEAVSTGNDFIFEHRFRRHDGEYRWQLSRAIPQKDQDGVIQMWVGSSTDIQDQKTFAVQLEKLVKERTKELKKSEERYHLMVEEVQDYAILFLNKKGIIENWNKGAEKIKGYTADEIVGKNFSVFYTEKDKESKLPEYLLKQAELTGKANQEGWRVRKNGSLFWASVVITAVHDEKNKVIGFSKFTHDLSEKKAADDMLKRNAAELEQKNIDLEKMNKELQSFTYISSHDLQEPLRKIQTFSSRIIDKEYENLSESGKDSFQRMQNAARRMQILIDDLLAYSRTNNSDQKKFEKANLVDIVEEVKEELAEEFAIKDAVIEIGDICDFKIIPFQFRQLLQNLFTNSIKFSIKDKPLHIKIDCVTELGEHFQIAKLLPEIKYHHITITDNGIGFEPIYREKIFEVFQRLHNKEQYMGTGIGLAIVKKIIENHHGIITASGESNKGATFNIYIPADPTKI
jgi:PAS domain S-box-containing protein